MFEEIIETQSLIFITLALIVIVLLCSCCYFCCCRAQHPPIEALKEYIPTDLLFDVYEVKTTDGYILELFRVRNPVTINESWKPVYLQHGLGAAANQWLINGRNQSLGLILADQGYDVWMGNNRGTYHSKHETLKDTHREFWEFSFQDFKEDILSQLNFVKMTTEMRKIHYIGHSQGTTSIIAALSEFEGEHRTELSDLICEIILLAPVVYLKESPPAAVKCCPCLPKCLFSTLRACGVHNIPASNLQKCSCRVVLSNCLRTCCPCCLNRLVFKGTDKTNVKNNYMAAPTFFRFFPAGHSVKSLQHFIQIASQDESTYFKKFNHGADENLKHYGSQTPPEYDLGLISHPVTIFWGNMDKYTSPKSIELLTNSLTNCSRLDVKMYNDWGHMGFVFGIEVDKLGYDIIEILEKAEANKKDPIELL